MHVNTVGHRVKRIRELTGHDPTPAADLVDMALALRWLDLTAASTPRDRT